MSDVTLSKAIRSNLLHLQNTAKLMDVTQERLATGKKVNSALDNPTNFFTASALNSRAADISTLLDSMSNGVQTIEMADHGLTAITKNIESMQSTLRQARQDKSFQVASYQLNPEAAVAGVTETGNARQLSFIGGVFDDESMGVDLSSARAIKTAGTAADPGDLTTQQSFTIAVNGGNPVTVTVSAIAADPDEGTPAQLNLSINGQDYTTTIGDPEAVTGDEMRTALNAAFGASGIAVNVGATQDGELTFTGPVTGSSQASITITGGEDLLGVDTDASTALTDVQARTVDQLVNVINSNPDLRAALRASNDNGKLRIENLSTAELTVTGFENGEITGGENTSKIEGNDIRANLAIEYNRLLTALDGFVSDASYNGVNLLRGDILKIVFNEHGTSMVEIQTRNAKGEARPIDAGTLGLTQIDASQLDLDGDIDDLLAGLQKALGEVRSQASDLGMHLSVVKNRENFTKQMINTLQTGAANLTLADSNEEAANMLALQTRQQLSQTALSLANQADQAVLRLFG